MALFCIGLPLALLVSIYFWRRGTVMQQNRIALLVQSYAPHAWMYEPIDLLRKWVLSAAVLLVQPNTRWQLVFGAFASTAVIGFNLVMKPYRWDVCVWRVRRCAREWVHPRCAMRMQ